MLLLRLLTVNETFFIQHLVLPEQSPSHMYVYSCTLCEYYLTDPPGRSYQAGSQSCASSHGGARALVPEPAHGVLRRRPNRCPTAGR